jgi:hypothetical protein
VQKKQENVVANNQTNMNRKEVKQFVETLHFHGYIAHDITKLDNLIDDYYPKSSDTNNTNNGFMCAHGAENKCKEQCFTCSEDEKCDNVEYGLFLRQQATIGLLFSIDTLDDESNEIHKIGKEIAEMSDEEFEANTKAISDMFLNSRSNQLSHKVDTQLPIGFVKWYSGMKEEKILKAYDRWKNEIGAL